MVLSVLKFFLCPPSYIFVRSGCLAQFTTLCPSRPSHRARLKPRRSQNVDGDCFERDYVAVQGCLVHDTRGGAQHHSPYRAIRRKMCSTARLQSNNALQMLSVSSYRVWRVGFAWVWQKRASSCMLISSRAYLLCML